MWIGVPTNDPDQSFNNQSKPKQFFSFIKSLITDNSGVDPLTKELSFLVNYGSRVVDVCMLACYVGCFY
jgi:hypothetical protein